MDFGIKQKVALITGASSGLGYACAEILLEEGANVAICSRNPEKITKAVSTLLEKAGNKNRVFGKAVDYNDTTAMQTYVSEVREKLGEPDILVCSSGGPAPGVATAFQAEDYLQAIENNAISLARLTLNLIPTMQARKWGRVVYITSSAAVQPIPSLALSNMARCGLHGFAKTLATEIAKDGVTVNCVMPGRINTDRIISLTRKNAADHGRTLQEQMSRDFETMPAGRYGQPRELANVVGFLCSDCASYVTGSAIAVDGGAIPGLR